jgi:hypothetical protein
MHQQAMPSSRLAQTAGALPGARLVACRVVKSKDKYSLGKDFFTNVTPGYQLYPSVYYLPWTDPAAPSECACRCCWYT